jgi:hypothetical protein
MLLGHEDKFSESLFQVKSKQLVPAENYSFDGLFQVYSDIKGSVTDETSPDYKGREIG